MATMVPMTADDASADLESPPLSIRTEDDSNSSNGGGSSDEGVNVVATSTSSADLDQQQPTSQTSSQKMTSGMEFGRSPDHHSELNPHSVGGQFGGVGPGHPLGVLGNLNAALNMNVQNLSGLSGLASAVGLGGHGDVLEKLKMQVRDMKVGLGGGAGGGDMAGGADFAASLHASFGASALQHQQQLAAAAAASGGGVTGMFGGVDGLRAGGNSGGSGNGSNGGGAGSATSGGGGASGGTSGGSVTANGAGNWALPNAPAAAKDANPGSNSSTSSETSNSSQQNNNNNNGWSFEEQFKQVRQLYEINDDPKRKEFLDDLFLFMQKRGTPINRLPIMAKSVLDLYELYNLVIARGGLVDVINKKLWQEIIKGLHLPSSITSAAFTLRTQYMKYLYPYECEKKNLSTPAELQAAIDGNRREGRRSSYGQFESPSVQRSPIPPQGIQQMSPLSLVTHVNQQQQHHRLLGAPNVGQIPNLLPAEFEQRMLDYIKLFQPKTETKREQSPEQMTLNALEMSRVALWNMYNNNTSPPNSLQTSPPEMQREALNLSESPPHHLSIKRERDLPMDFTDRSGRGDFHSGLPPAKRSNNNSIAAVAVAQLQQQQHHHQLGIRSLTPQKLNMSHDEDDARSDGTPINLRGVGIGLTENGLRHHHDHHGDGDLPDVDDEEEDDDEEMTMPEDDAPHHPLALNRITEHAAAALVAAQREQAAQNHLASLNLSLLERERCDSADKLKRQQQQLHLEQLQREQLLHHQQQQQQQALQRERERELQQRERDIQKAKELQQQQLLQQEQNRLREQQAQREQQREQQQQQQNGDRLSGAGLETVGSNNTSTSSEHHSQGRSGSANGGAFSPGSANGGQQQQQQQMGIMGMQFKLISRGDATKGDQQLVVSMEFNGVQYEGVLFANPAAVASATGSSPARSASSPQQANNTSSNNTSTTSSSGIRATSSPSSGGLLMTTAVAPLAEVAGSPMSSNGSTSAAASPSLISPAKSSSIDEPMGGGGIGVGLSGPPPVVAPRPIVS